MANDPSQGFSKEKTGNDIGINTLHWYGLWFIDTNLRSILLYVYFYSCLRYYVYTAHLKM